MTDEKEPFGLTILVNKPIEWTSFDVVNKLRYTAKRVTQRKKIKVGHAGTLDPLATGLLVICVGAHTKTIDTLMGLNKTYDGKFRIGATTPSFDLETEIDHEFPIPTLNDSRFKEIASQFTGEIEQYPPIFSAKKIDGQKAYELARKGKNVEMRPSTIHISSFEVSFSEYPDVAFSLCCSKGTYVRSLANDYGKALGSGAHLIELRRTKIGDFHLKSALSIDEAIKHIEVEYIKYLQTPSI